MKTVIIYLLILAGFTLKAQTNKEIIYLVQNAVDSGKYKQAIEVIDRSLSDNSEPRELLVYKARILGWTGEWASADSLVSNLLSIQPHDHELLLLKAQYLYWGDANVLLDQLARKALLLYPQELMFSYYLAISNFKLKNYEYALKHANRVYTLAPEFPHIKALKNNIESSFHNYVVGRISYTGFNGDHTPWKSVRVGFGSMKKSRWESSITLAQRFQKTALNFEINSYPRLGKLNYLHVQAFKSTQSAFPKHKFSLEFYQSIKSLEFSAGSKFMAFQDADVWLHHVSSAVYYKDIILQYRMYLTVSHEHLNTTHMFRFRKYLKNESNFIEIEMTNGTNPVDFNNDTDTQVTKSRRLGFKYCYTNKSRIQYSISSRYRTDRFDELQVRRGININAGLRIMLH